MRIAELIGTAGSRLNGLIGARTQMSSIITSMIMILSIFFLLPYLYVLPKVRLAAIREPGADQYRPCSLG